MRSGPRYSQIAPACNEVALLPRRLTSVEVAAIHPYPTRAEAIRKTGDAWNRLRLTPGTTTWLGRCLRQTA